MSSAIVLLLFCAPALAAPAFEKTIPEDALAVVLVRNCTELGEKYKAHSAYKLWQEPSVQRFLEKPLDRLNEEIGKAEGKAGVTKDQVLGLFKGQLGFFVVADPPGEGGTVFMIEVGDQGEEAQRIVEAFVSAVGREAPNLQLRTVEEEFEGVGLSIVMKANEEDPVLVYAVVDDVLLLGGPAAVVKRAVTGLRNPPPRSIAAGQVYGDALERVGRDADVIAFVNIQRIIDLVTSMRPEGAQGMERTLGALGVDGLVSASMGIHVTREEAVSRLFLKIAGRPRGIVKMIVPEPGPLHGGADVPADAAGFMATRFDFAGNWDEFEKILQALNPMMLQQLKQQELALTQQIGEPFSIRNDIVAVFGPGVSFYQKFEKPFNLSTSQRVVIAVDISGKTAFDNLLNKLRKVAPMVFAMMQPQDYMGRQIYVFTPPRPPNAPPPAPGQMPVPAFAATDNSFVFSNNVETLKAHLRLLGKDGETMAGQQAFQEALRKLPADRRVMISHSNPKPQVEMLLSAMGGPQGEMFLGALRGNPQIAEFLDLFDFALLPPSEDVTKHLVSSTSCAVRLPDGILLVGRSPAKP